MGETFWCKPNYRIRECYTTLRQIIKQNSNVDFPQIDFIKSNMFQKDNFPATNMDTDSENNAKKKFQQEREWVFERGGSMREG